jgi:hypothetical protein
MRRIVLRMPPEMVAQIDDLGARMFVARDQLKHFDVLQGKAVPRAAVARLLLNYAITSLRSGADTGDGAQLSEGEAALLKLLDLLG